MTLGEGSHPNPLLLGRPGDGCPSLFVWDRTGESFVRSLGHGTQQVSKTGRAVQFRFKGLGGQYGNTSESDPGGVNFGAGEILRFGCSVPGSQATSKGYLPFSMYCKSSPADWVMGLILLS